MPTKALETWVIPTLEEVQFHFTIREDGKTVLFPITTPVCTLQWSVRDYPKMRLLSIEAWNLVSFPATDTTVHQLCTQFNRKRLGKFFPDDQGRIDYSLELPYTDDTTPQQVRHALYLAFGTVEDTYPEWMRARWADKPKRASRKDPSRRSKSVKKLIEEALNQDSP